MKTYEDAYATAKDERPFSNGTEGYAWTETWCDTCVHDREGRAGTGSGCPLLCVAILGRTPVEWTENEPRYQLGNTYTCSEYVEDDDDDGDDPQPQPEPGPPPTCEGQLDLIDAYLDTAIDELSKAPVMS